MIDAPHDTVTSDLLARLKAHRAELLAKLQTASSFVINLAPDAETVPIDSASTKSTCPCGSTTWRDVANSRRAIHPARLRTMRSVSRLRGLVRTTYFTK
jgi:hypothetical protein